MVAVGGAFEGRDLVAAADAAVARQAGQPANPNLRTEIAANDFTSLQDAIDAAEAHAGSEAIVRTDDGHFHLHQVSNAPANSIVFRDTNTLRQSGRAVGIQTLPPGEALRAARTMAQHGDIDRSVLSAALYKLSTDPSPANLALARQLQSTLATTEFGRRNPAAVAQFAAGVAEFDRPLPGGTVTADGSRYGDPTAMLNQLTQHDQLGDNITSNDRDRCGAASVVGIAIMQGPQAVADLAFRHGVQLDAQHPTAGGLHLLMERVYQDMVDNRGTPGAPAADDPNRTGLYPTEVNRLLSQQLGRSQDPQIIGATPRSVDWSSVGSEPVVLQLDASNTGSRALHFVALQRSTDGSYTMYDPDPTNGAAPVRHFADQSALVDYLNHHTTTLEGRSGIVGIVGAPHVSPALPATGNPQHP